MFIDNTSKIEKSDSLLREVKSLGLFDEELNKGKKLQKHKRQDTKILANMVSSGSGNRCLFENSSNSNSNMNFNLNLNLSTKNFAAVNLFYF